MKTIESLVAAAAAHNAATAALTKKALEANAEIEQLLDTKADQIIFPCGVSIGSDEEKGYVEDGSQINIGQGSLAWGSNSIAIGHNAKAKGSVNVVIGKDCSIAAGGYVRNVIIGAESLSTENVTNGVAIGVGHTLTEAGEIAIGAGDDGVVPPTEAAKANTLRVKGGVLTVGGKVIGGGGDNNGCVYKVVDLGNSSIISLRRETTIYKIAMIGASSIDFTAPSLAADEVIVFWLWVVMGETAHQLAFPSTVTWLSEGSFAANSQTMLAFMSTDGGATWQANVQWEKAVTA